MNLLDQLEQPLTAPAPSTLEALLNWSLQFEVNGALVLCVLCALFLLGLWELRIRFRHRETLALNMRRYRASSFFSALR